MEPAQQFLEKWLEHNADLTRRQLESDLDALARKLAARGLHASGGHIVEAIKLSNKSVTEFCRLAVDKASTLPELTDGLKIVREGVTAFAAEILARIDRLAAKIAPGGVTEGLRREMRERQKPITTDLDSEFALAELQRQIGGYSPPRRASWDATDREKAAIALESKLSPHLHFLAAAAWAITRDESAATSSRAAIDRIEAMPGGWQNSELLRFEQAVAERLIPVYGLTGHRGWEPVPVEAFQPEAFSLGPSRLSNYGDLYVMAADLLALFPPMSASHSAENSAKAVDATPSDSARKPKRASAPPLKQAALLAWWESIADRRDSFSRVALAAMVKTAHPEHHVSRSRLRALTANRKRGKKRSAEN